jgi:hypothetical protein
MDAVERCPECGAAWQEGQTCQDHFHQMLFWEAEYPAYGVEVHHYMVLCYHLQHPSLYSAEMLSNAVKMLGEFVAGVSPQVMRQRLRPQVDSGKRDYKITARPDSYGAYAHPVQWTMTAADVTAGSVHDYPDNVRAWAGAMWEDLKAAGIVQSS